MAVIQAQGGNDWLGTLGNIASLAGTFVPGMQWLTPLGLEMQAANSIATGNTSSLEKSLSAMKDAGTFDNLLGKANTAQNPLVDAQTAFNNWDRFYRNGSTGGYSNPWQL